MRYGSTTLATNFRPPDWKLKMIKTLLFFIPAANPHSERLYPQVKKWLVEVDDDGSPNREVALDSEGRALFCAPDGRDFGFWTDSNVTLAGDALDPITVEEFERRWAEVKKGAHPVGTDNSGAAPRSV
jgi:hypothetical protein